MLLSEVLFMFLPNWSQIDHFGKGQLHSSSYSGKTLWVTPTPLFSRHFTLQSLSKSYLFHLKKKNLEPEKLFEHPILISYFKQLLLPKWLPCFTSYFSCYHLFSNFKTYQTMSAQKPGVVSYLLRSLQRSIRSGPLTSCHPFLFHSLPVALASQTTQAYFYLRNFLFSLPECFFLHIFTVHSFRVFLKCHLTSVTHFLLCFSP